MPSPSSDWSKWSAPFTTLRFLDSCSGPRVGLRRSWLGTRRRRLGSRRRRRSGRRIFTGARRARPDRHGNEWGSRRLSQLLVAHALVARLVLLEHRQNRGCYKDRRVGADEEADEEGEGEVL